MIDFETAERAAGYYNAVRDLETQLEEELKESMGEEAWDEGNHDGYLSHPDWDLKSDALADEWNLSPEEDDVLGKALDAGLSDYLSPEDILECVS